MSVRAVMISVRPQWCALIANGKTGYAWHISCLKIYEEPKELNEFVCNGKTINRPPQSWCYVGELEI